jgi:hypothetical protein
MLGWSDHRVSVLLANIVCLLLCKHLSVVCTVIHIRFNMKTDSKTDKRQSKLIKCLDDRITRGSNVLNIEFEYMTVSSTCKENNLTLMT